MRYLPWTGVQTCALPISPRGRKSLSALYRNNHNGTFTDITAGSGLDIEMYALGVAIGDFDNEDRKSVVEGKSVDLGGRRIIQKKKQGKRRALSLLLPTVP